MSRGHGCLEYALSTFTNLLLRSAPSHRRRNWSSSTLWCTGI